MQTLLHQLIDEAIQLELNVAHLYIDFHLQFKEDATFWWKLAIEEENHAALLKTVKTMLDTQRLEIPRDLLPEKLESLKDSNALIWQMQEEFKQAPGRKKAFLLGIELERSAGELHYDQFMHKTPDSKLQRVFRKLNGDDMDHANRIEEYMNAQGISE